METNTDMEWLLNGLPRGESLNVECAYPFSRGKREPDESDLPDGWRIEWDAEDEDVVAAGWDDPRPTLNLIPLPEGARVARFVYLRDPKGDLVATWDEGRWWTPEEGRAFLLMGLVPAVHEMSELYRPGVNRKMRRRFGRGRS